MTRRKSAVLALILAVVALPACAALFLPSYYSAEPIEGRVVDRATGQPLPDVVVVAHWLLESGNAGGTFTIGNLQVLETLTDSNGSFYFPAWGPLPRKQGGLTNRDPELLFFKPGYEYVEVWNEYREGAYFEPVRRSEWNGKTIELRPGSGATAGYARNLRFFNTAVESIVLDHCNWKRIPKLLLALRRQLRIFEAAGVHVSFANADYVSTNAKECGSPEEFFRNYRP